MIISKKKYEKLNNDLVEAKAKVDDAKKALDDENKIMKVNLLIKEQRDDYKTQRDALIDDIAVLRANNERLERENECEKEWFYKYSCELEHIVKHERDTIKRLERENEKLKTTNENLNNRVCNLNLTAQIEHDDLMSCDGEVRYWKDKYATLTNHIRDMKFASPYSYNYIHLVNFIKELERD